jgi:putative ABC transport system ATP-binding protein
VNQSNWTSANGVALTASGLTKYFASGRGRVAALQAVDCQAASGALTMLMGPSGSGKSTLLAVMSGLLQPDSGNVTALGLDLWSLTNRKRDEFRLLNCGFIFQGFNLFPALTALNQVSLVLRYKGFSSTEANRLARNSLEEVGLGQHLNKRPKELSGGEMQRVAIARALAKSPALLFADEPTSALDGENGRIVLDLLHRAAIQNNTAVVCVTHDQRIASRADRLIYIEDGQMRSESTPEIGERH